MPTVWYIAAGYRLPAGVEAYLLHYATELRNHGFDTRVCVFQPLPREEHRYLRNLRDRQIPIRSLYSLCALRVWVLFAALCLPWAVYLALARRRRPRLGWFLNWLRKRCSSRLLARLIAREEPDVIHVKARVIAEAWGVFPPERTVYQHALSGTVDPAWNEAELGEFRAFANRCAKVLVQGPHIAATMAREFGIERPIDTVFTMAPDEAPRSLIEELQDHRPRTTDHRPERETTKVAKGRERGRGGAEQGRNRRWRPMDAHGEEFGKSASGNEHPSPDSGDSNDFDAVNDLTNDQCPVTNDRPLRFGIVCRFTEQKGISYILRALRMYRDRHGDVDFTFAGRAGMEGDIRAFIAANGLEHVRVRDVPDAVTVLRALDVFVHPGIDDAMPVSIVEAFMCGVPCIGTRVGGVQDLIRDGVDGVLIEPRSADAILEAMERFAAVSEAELWTFKRSARERYEECCTPDKVGALVARHYREVMEGAARRGTEGEDTTNKREMPRKA